MSETIVLPRSGVKATVEFRASVVPGEKGSWHIRVPGFMGTVGTDKEDDLAWLDQKALEARAALMPADARERVLNVLVYQYGEAHTGDVDAVLAALNGGTDV